MKVFSELRWKTNCGIKALASPRAVACPQATWGSPGKEKHGREKQVPFSRTTNPFTELCEVFAQILNPGGKTVGGYF